MTHIKETIQDEALVRPLSYKRYQFEGLKLDNGMEVLLMSSPTIDMSSCCIGVGVGSNDDPKEYQGLAHFCEHMLFMGNDKYPDEEEYERFMTKGGGIHNATTYANKTLYYSSVKPDMLEGLVDRLSNFFLTPHFNASAVNREVEAVNSEFEMSFTKDGRRCYTLRQHLLNQEHPWTKFNCGNNKELRRLDLYPDGEESLKRLREALIKFHASHYSSTIMFGFVAGRESLEQLREMTISRFSQFKAKEIHVPRGSARGLGINPLRSDGYQKQLIMYVPTATEKRQIEFSFLIPDQYDKIKSKPSGVLSHVFGHEGPGSILAYLKREGWALGLRAGADELDVGLSWMEIAVDFTEKGDSMEVFKKIGEAIYATLRIMIESGLPDWLVDECSQMLKLEFEFEEVLQAPRLASEMAKRIHMFGVNKTFSGILFERNPKQDALELLEVLKTCHLSILLQATSCEPHCNQTEPIYGSKYHEQAVPADWEEAWSRIMTCSASEFKAYCDETGIHLMKPNQYVPRDLSIRPGGQPLDVHPVCLPGTCFYHKQDGHFKLPLVSMKLLWHLPAIRPTVQEMDLYLSRKSGLTDIQTSGPFDGYEWYRRIILVKFVLDMIDESLREETYDADVLNIKFAAGLRDSSGPFNRGVTMGCRGYNEKTGLLLSRYLTQTHDFVMTGKELPVVYSARQRQYATLVQTQEPYVTCARYVAQILGLSEYSDVEIAELIKTWTEADLASVLKAPPKWTRSGGSMRGSIFGNVDSETAMREFVKPVLTLCEGDNSQGVEVCPSGVLVLQRAGDVLVKTGCGDELECVNDAGSTPKVIIDHETTLNIESPDNACMLCVQCPGAPIEADMHAMLIDNWLSNSFFDDLRTKQSLGYVCGVMKDLDPRLPSLRFVIQSTKASRFLLSRVENFILSFVFGAEDGVGADLNKVNPKITEVQWEENKAAVVSVLETKPKSMAEQSERYASNVLNETFDFARREKGAAYVKSMTLESFKKVLTNVFINNVWLAVCLDSRKLDASEADYDFSKSLFSHYKMKDQKSLKSTVWHNAPDRYACFNTYPVTP
eukprot:Blabericola_migrator_1__1267@NODE_1328_length_4787_cov_239_438771_g634_i1_p1_GENE_NODE_1328_length_4787_cov_239_438771_g634_i1NODE_1328_length_4787_cov_239_438771_g634_i1_p1_ORF_typecomplete_len1061_score269_75Peptidase_M16_M/PF16187_5/1_2e32Peptidase_M16/PF00675_20/8_5e32Peptidase_M16/PF00675_20/1_1e04Peptidase_M16_C/PF05193_21/4_5e10Peptidase_M16_C/PF05193_21/0_32Peptidase_M16_C/PF05193_21/1_3e03_NODE_1328_length_4787_cov_239_438771_g634_i19164098